VSVEEARRLDASDELLEAAALYEEAIRCESTDLSVYLDLAVLYFVLLDFGEVHARGLPRTFQDEAWNRVRELLAEAESRFGPNADVAFWKRYINFAYLGDPFSEHDCRVLCAKAESLDPHFFLFAATQGKESREEATRLLAVVESGETARKRYVRSVLKSPALRFGPSPAPNL